MAILIVDPTYPDNEDLYDQFYKQLLCDLRAEFGSDAELDEVDAGPGWSTPGLVLHIAELAALGLAFMSAPEIIEKNLPKWKRIIDKLVSFLRANNLEYSVDAITARNLALFYVLNQLSSSYDSVELRSCIQHSMNQEFVCQEVDFQDTESDPQSTILLQLDCRFVLGFIVDDHMAFTVVIEKNGACSYLRRL